eukprot:CAMPEP_0178711618 /NCGR_PEP_ID=MMETSP0699-20121125/18439_1 /TAXON_ID=265572 /ORGANISM="Extubocellulus spinifer, Strain CCMP396" /LENGTH=92 /DNA_ID=CAMNT_0020360303 /DNA_START=532 /DNA_END=807 /DNA_ORIENTATION=+
MAFWFTSGTIAPSAYVSILFDDVPKYGTWDGLSFGHAPLNGTTMAKIRSSSGSGNGNWRQPCTRGSRQVWYLMKYPCMHHSERRPSGLQQAR